MSQGGRGDQGRLLTFLEKNYESFFSVSKIGLRPRTLGVPRNEQYHQVPIIIRHIAKHEFCCRFTHWHVSMVVYKW